jgi:RsiW-degrading membrane proteinase PrsW (M82 family)
LLTSKQGIENTVSFEPILLAPQKVEREIYPYRRVWRTAIIEVAILLAVTVAATLLQRFAPLQLAESQRRLFGGIFALLPFALWLGISYLAERRSPQPRQRLFVVALLGALVANAVGLPLVKQVIAVDEWLSTASGTSRILGYLLSVGIIQEFLKYAVVRYSVWPGCFRIRSDGIAYAMAAAIGYATVLNLDYALNITATPAIYTLRITEITMVQLAVSTIVGYFLSELKLTRNTAAYWLPGGLLLAALLDSLAIVFRGGLIVGGVSPDSTANNAFQGLGAAVFLVVFLFSSVNFLVNNADERATLRSRTELGR